MCESLCVLEWGEGQRQRISGSLRAEHGVWAGLDLTTLKSWPELKPRVACLTDCATQVAPMLVVLNVFYRQRLTLDWAIFPGVFVLSFCFGYKAVLRWLSLLISRMLFDLESISVVVFYLHDISSKFSTCSFPDNLFLGFPRIQGHFSNLGPFWYVRRWWNIWWIFTGLGSKS